MKNIHIYINLLLLLFTLFGCTDEDVVKSDNGDLRVIGRINETSSKTGYEVGEDKVTVTWLMNDEIGLFTDEQTSLMPYKATSNGKQTDFIPVNMRLEPLEGKNVYAFYPFIQSNTVFPYVPLPGHYSQEYTSELPSAEDDLMYAKGKIIGNELVLNFKHLFSFIKLNIKSEVLKGTQGLFVYSSEPIMYVDYLSDPKPYFDCEKEEIVGEKINYLWYSIPEYVIDKNDVITCYIAVLPTTEDNYFTFFRKEDGKQGDGIFERKAPEGGLKAGHIYDLTINEVERNEDEIEREEREILIEFYQATGGPQWYNNTNWCSDKPIAEWYGVSKTNGVVEGLNLMDNHLTGSIPEKIGNLHYLKHLYLGYNQLTGELPESLAGISSLKHVDLSNNLLEGTIPESYAGLMDALQTFNLRENHFTGRWPEAMVNHPKWKDLWIGCLIGSMDMTGVKLPVADFVVQDIYGNTISSDVELAKNKLTAILHWHPTCPFSSMYIEDQLLSLYEQYKDKGFEIIGYCSETKEGILDYVNKHQITWKNIELQTADGEIQLPGFFVRSTPTIFLVDQNKEVIFQSITQNRNEIAQVLAERLGEAGLYTSSDYSKDGEVQMLQQATEGKGINLVFMGEAFVDKDMGEGGLYEQVMHDAMEQFFAYEPIKSFRNRFNVYSVKVVSPNAEFYPNAVHRINEDNQVCFEYAKKIPGLEQAPYQMISVIYNKGCNERSYTSMYAGDRSFVAYMMEGVNDVLNHEACGHGLGKLLDEYVENGYENLSLPDAERETMDFEWNQFQLGANVDWRNNEETVKWAHFLKDSRYAGENLGLFEGAYLYGKGAYRPTENSMMRFNNAPFNAPSRERIYQVIMEMSEGDQWKYDYEDFVSYDYINRDYTLSNIWSRYTTKSVREHWMKRHRVPVVVKGTWKDAK